MKKTLGPLRQLGKTYQPPDEPPNASLDIPRDKAVREVVGVIIILIFVCFASVARFILEKAEP